MNIILMVVIHVHKLDWLVIIISVGLVHSQRREFGLSLLHMCSQQFLCFPFPVSHQSVSQSNFKCVYVRSCIIYKHALSQGQRNRKGTGALAPLIVKFSGLSTPPQIVPKKVRVQV